MQIAPFQTETVFWLRGHIPMAFAIFYREKYP